MVWKRKEKKVVKNHNWSSGLKMRIIPYFSSVKSPNWYWLLFTTSRHVMEIMFYLLVINALLQFTRISSQWDSIEQAGNLESAESTALLTWQHIICSDWPQTRHLTSFGRKWWDLLSNQCNALCLCWCPQGVIILEGGRGSWIWSFLLFTSPVVLYI